MRTLKAHFLPDLTAPEKLAGGAVVVIDVLRATTVIAHALAAGARQVIPCLEVDEALRIAQTLPKGQAVLAGERDGLKIDRFDLGNSPAEFTPESVAGKTLVFTTTNGTRAMTYCRDARRVIIGAFVNGSSAMRWYDGTLMSSPAPRVSGCSSGGRAGCSTQRWSCSTLVRTWPSSTFQD